MSEIITGKTRSDLINQESLIISMEDFAARLEEPAAALETLTRKCGGVKSVGRMKHQWRERRLRSMTDVVTAIAAKNATSIAVSNPQNFHLNEMIVAPKTGDMFFVDEAVGGTTTAGEVKVRGKAGNGGIGAALAVADILIICGEAHAEGDPIPPAFANKETDLFAYLWQTDETINVTDIQNAEEQYGLKEIMAQRRDKAIEQLKKLALTMYVSVGGRETVSANGARRHTPSGLIEFLADQKTDASAIVGGLTRTTMGNIMRTTLYGHSSEQKVNILGQNAWAAVSAMADTYLRADSKLAASWGIQVTKLITAFGAMNLTYDEILTDEYGLAGEMFTLDTKHIKQLQLRGLPFVMKTNVQDKKDAHNIIDLYTGTRGLMLELPELHHRTYGITA